MSSNVLPRFHSAQADGYAAALAEIRTTGKRTHWIWYVFPQLAGLGRSAEAQRYALAGRVEARAYLEDPLLRTRLLEITTAVADKLEQGWSLVTIMGSTIDTLKLVSSLTLFERIARELNDEAANAEFAALTAVTERVLTAAAAQGHERCAFTTRALTA